MGVRRKRRLTKPYEVDEVATAEAVVAFYEERLEQALARLGEAIEARDIRKKGSPSRRGAETTES